MCAMAAVVEFNTLPQLFQNLVDHYRGQDRGAVFHKDKGSKQWVGITWEVMEERVHALTGFLHKRGIRKGDRVALISENRPEWMMVDMATQLLGGVNVSLYTSLPASQIAYILRDSGAELVFVSTSIQLRKVEQIFDECPDLKLIVTMSDLRKEHEAAVLSWDAALSEGGAFWQEHAPALSELSSRVQPDDLCALIYTSGTTGDPKGVMLTHENFVSNVRAALMRVPFGEDDHHLSFLPLCHSFERTGGYTAVLACGARISYAESIDTVSRNLLEVHPTVLISVPVVFERVYNTIRRKVEEGSAIKKWIFNWAVTSGKRAAAARKNGRVGPVTSARARLGHRLVFSTLHEKLGGNLRFAVSGGAALSREVGEFFEAAGILLLEGYGLTETAPVLAVNPYDRPQYGMVGHVIPGVTVAIQRLDDGEMLGVQSGDDYPSSLSTEDGEILARGPNIMRGYWNNEAATREVIDGDGWYHTGDVGRFENGYLRITDRIKHMIVSAGGKNIYPGPIEDQFKADPFIDQIVVMGEGREYLTALVVPNLESLEQFAREKGIAYAEPLELLAHDAVREHFTATFRTFSRGAAAHEKIRDFSLLREPFTVDNALLTPTLKPRRRRIEEAYRDEIASMYGSD